MSVAAIARRPVTPFAAQHASDRNFFLALLVLSWAGIIGGFGLDWPTISATRTTPIR